MASGSGKSLCYQMVSIMGWREGEVGGEGGGKIVIVVSPLISLMEDQVMKVNEAGMKGCFLGTAQTDGGITRDAWLVCNLPFFFSSFLLLLFVSTYSSFFFLLSLASIHSFNRESTNLCT